MTLTREDLHEAGISLHAIVAMGENRVIGHRGKLPWYLPEDLKLFKRTTLGHPIVMGRKTWESFLRRPLPGRRNIVLSRTMPPNREADVLPTFDALTNLGITGEVFLLGGAEVFRQGLPLCDRVTLSLVYGRPVGDSYMPAFEDDFEMVGRGEKFPEFEVILYRRT